MEVKLNDPEKSAQGFVIKASMKPSFQTKWDNNNWKNEEELVAILLEVQKQVLATLFEKRTTWFATPPSKSQLQKLCNGWDIKNLATPPDVKKSFTGSQLLGSILISQNGISPRWISTVWEEVAKISMPWMSAEEGDELLEVDDSREINIDVEGGPVTLKPHEDRNYRDRKFAAKERVKEARLKAQVAKRQAQRELRFFFDNFTLDDNESSFSDYDLTDNESESEYEYDDEEEEVIRPTPGYNSYGKKATKK
jgi:hypothetical protein